MRKSLIILCAFFMACNPVKRVLNDPLKFDKVKEAVIRGGYCINDTTIIETIKDSVIYRDSLVEFKVPCPDVDTIIGHDGTQISISSGVLTAKVKAKETQKIIKVTNTVRDRSLENLLKKDIAWRDSTIKVYEGMLASEQKVSSEQRKAKNTWKWRFWGMIAGFAIYKLRRPIFKMISAI